MLDTFVVIEGSEDLLNLSFFFLDRNFNRLLNIFNVSLAATDSEWSCDQLNDFDSRSF